MALWRVPVARTAPGHLSAQLAADHRRASGVTATRAMTGAYVERWSYWL
ncbi:hypothetical protein [Streptomyces sp. NBC_01235]|nr:hypothetical protein OG289_06280 [Streptomyces sp. NBC_01235]